MAKDSKPKIAIIVDVEGWAYYNNALEIKKNLTDYYDIDIIPIDIFNENIVKVFILTTDYDLTYFMWRGAISWLYSETSREYIEDLGYEFEEFLQEFVRSRNITTGVYNNLNESLKQSLSLLELQKQFLNLPPELHFHSDLSNYSEDLGGLPEDDFVIVDDTTVKTYELPDSVYIPIGNNRIKMPTSFLLALIDLIISTILTISIAIA